MIMSTQKTNQSIVIENALFEFEKIINKKLSPMEGLMAINDLFTTIYIAGKTEGIQMSKINQN